MSAKQDRGKELNEMVECVEEIGLEERTEELEFRCWRMISSQMLAT